MIALPVQTEPDDVDRYVAAARFVHDHRRRGHLRLVASDGESLELPDRLADLLDDVAEALAEGSEVSVIRNEALITTSQAAKILGISRPTLVRLLDLGEISYAQPGTHRRLKLSDVLDYRAERERRSDELHRAMADEADELGGYDWTAADHTVANKRLKNTRKKLAQKYDSKE